jgi:hypothetical protein
VRKGDVGGLALDRAGAKNMLPKPDELLITRNAGQKYSVSVEWFWLAKVQGHGLRGNVRKTSEKRAVLHWGKLLLPA